MELDILQINGFLKKLPHFRETINIADFFFSPHIIHLNRPTAKDICETHEQQNFEISLLLKGQMIYNIEKKEVLLRSGDVIIIPPRTKHYWHVLEESDIFGFMINISRTGDNSRRDLALLYNSIKKHNYRIKNFSVFDEIIRQIINEALEEKAACKDKVLYLIRLAFVELIRVLLPEFSRDTSQHNMPPARGENEKDIVAIVHYYIQDNINRPISLREISNYVGLSIGHLNFLFKKETKTTINQVIINRRLEWACRYLKQTDRQINDIATLLGYQDINYFYLQFKKKYGLTPSQYRRSN